MSGGVDWTEARPGDVVFFPPEQGDPISEWIAEADTGRFSHVGMNVGDGYVVNAALRDFRSARQERFDLGGIVLMQMEELSRGRSGAPYLGRPAVDPAAALDVAKSFVEGTEPSELHKSGYSMSKALVMMAALCAAHSRDDRLKSLTLRAGELWSVDTEIKGQETPSFICAEFVAQCYGMPFRWSDLESTLKVGQVPGAARQESEQPGTAEATASLEDLTGSALSPELSGLNADLGERSTGPLEEARDVFHHTFRQELALGHVIERLGFKHWWFLERCLKSGWELVVASASRSIHATKTDGADGDAFSPPPAPDADDPQLPFCLVTPRTLSHAAWFDWVRPVRFT